MMCFVLLYFVSHMGLHSFVFAGRFHGYKLYWRMVMLPCFHHGACLWPTPFLGRERPIPPSGCLSDGGGRECTPYHAWPWNSALRSCASGNDCRHICARWHLTFTARTGLLQQSNSQEMFSAILLTFASSPRRILVPAP